MLIFKNRKKYKLILLNDNINNVCINKDLYKQILDVKNDIDNYKLDWEKSKKLLNKYENIYISTNSNRNICNITPISRSFFKLQQIIINYKLINNNVNTFTCIAEGPGGFIQSILHYTKNNTIDINKIYGITLIDKDINSVPYWHQSILNNKEITILSGKDKTGNLYNIDNINNFIENITEKIDLITCDGGIDYSNNYNNQEISSYRLLYSEIFLTLNIQKDNGSSVIKFFDLLHIKTIQLIFILSLVYDSVYIYKPTFSRKTNSEKYIICKHYNKNDDIINLLKKYWTTIHKLNIKLPNDFMNKINNYNNIFINEQCDYINKILLINNYVGINSSKNDINECIKWCEMYQIPIKT